jgi:hypothetical protein
MKCTLVEVKHIVASMSKCFLFLFNSTSIFIVSKTCTLCMTHASDLGFICYTRELGEKLAANFWITSLHLCSYCSYAHCLRCSNQHFDFSISYFLLDKSNMANDVPESK